jgi:hypothetical protein
LHGADSRSVDSVPVTETYRGKTVWDEIVEGFALQGPPKAPKVYAWTRETDDPNNPSRHVAVLHIHAVTSPLLAARAAIVQEFRNAEAIEGLESRTATIAEGTRPGWNLARPSHAG